MEPLRLEHKYVAPFLAQHELDALKPYIAIAHEQLSEGTGLGGDFLGWLNLPLSYDRQEFLHLKRMAQRIQENSEILIVIGIGGSYQGAKAAIELLSHSFYNLLPFDERQTPQILFAGHAISSKYLQDLLELIDDRDFSVNVISKSGTTTEPALAFRIFRGMLEDKYGKEEAKNRIYVTTDAKQGALKKMAESEGYESFVIPDNVGGRYSVLTPVGLLPIAVAGLDVDSIMAGAAQAMQWYNLPDPQGNPAYLYAALRNLFYRKGKTIEILVNYEPAFQAFSEWWKQLFGESEGKDHKGLFPAAVNFTTDLHSLGQFMQEGTRNIFATTLAVQDSMQGYVIPPSDNNLDGLNYLAGYTLGHVNDQAMQGTILAHTDGGVPNLIVEIPQLSAFYFGALVYFFEKACAMSGYLLGINPFDQPGVEAYKKNMFALLGKPGFEEQRAKLKKRIEEV